jgi:predicted Rossmann fold nucleotide-binding protein DprA/Smf involved in DNA uptake
MRTSTQKNGPLRETQGTVIKSVGVIGSRRLPYLQANNVGSIVEDLIKRDYHIATGGAIGADQFVLERMIRLGNIRSLHRVFTMAKLCRIYR